jgi:alanyl-tRNA synthetase
LFFSADYVRIKALDRYRKQKVERKMKENYVNEYLTKEQKENLRFFESHLDEFRENPLYKHKYAIISGEKLVGIFDTFGNAIQEATSTLPEGAYVIQQIIRDDEIVSFLSPAIA